MKEKEVTLTTQELEDIKDTIKFRTSVMLNLKQLKGVPDRVTRAEVKLNVQWFLIAGVLVGLMSVVWRVLAK